MPKNLFWSIVKIVLCPLYILAALIMISMIGLAILVSAVVSGEK